MKMKFHLSFIIRHSAFTTFVIALVAAITVFTTTARALAQTGWGNALSFDGTNDYVVAGVVPLANSSFTIEAWARRDTSDSTSIYFLVGQGVGSTDLGLHFGFHYGSSFVLGFYNDDLWSAPGYTNTDWHHWAGTYDAGTRLRCLYRDGTLIASNTALANYQGSGTLTIGTAFGANFHGSIDDVRVWNVARSAEQIRQHLSHRMTGQESNLIAYWKFDEGAGPTAHDSTTNDYDGTLNGPPEWKPSTVPPWGKALSLDGTDDYVAITNFGTVMPTNEVTVEFWLRIITNKNDWPVVFGLNPDQTGNRFLVHVPSRYNYTIYWHFGDIGNGGRCQSYWQPLPLGEWRHFAFVASQSGNFMKVYINGAQHHSESNFNDLARGNYALELGRLFVGELDEFRVWNVARTPAEIQAGLSHPLTGAEANLVAYWNFDEGADTTAYDSTINGRNGILTNGVQWIPSTVPTPPVFRVCTLAAPGQLRLQAIGSAGLSYTLQTSTNLANWVNQTNLVADTNGLIECAVGLDSNVPACFYRVRWP